MKKAFDWKKQNPQELQLRPGEDAAYIFTNGDQLPGVDSGYSSSVTRTLAAWVRWLLLEGRNRSVVRLIKNGYQKENTMCRNIKTLFNFDPQVTDDEIHAASLQFVRKISGFNEPSKANEAAFNRAVGQVAEVARNLLGSLVTSAEPRNREVEIERARARSAKRFGDKED
ncbi:hypothetical protein DFP97_119128 [Paenibacillus prosopidis]|uniref:Uncharacterized protein n=2 Tax=Paenibacillus prosopidis TaxID=630520 RepID=A0A368VNH7_9BACL|nr:hypothetical protein DFP97_119128 [Paenibacillus prosopidis]